MTGTAETEAGELWSIYKLDVVVIPTNVPCIRKDDEDLVYKTKREKYKYVIEEIERLQKAGRPVLVGTTSVEVSELLSRMLKLKNLKHNVLNAKQHQREAEIVAEAGFPGAVTIATNMAVMDTFTDVAVAGSPNLATMAPGVSGALITTVTALCVAIPAMFGYNFLVTSIRGMIVEMDNFAAELSSEFEHKYVDHNARVPEYRR